MARHGRERPGNCDSFEKAAEFCAMTLNADADETFDDAAESALACWTSWWKFAGFCASLENSVGLAAIADITAELLASAEKLGSLASCAEVRVLDQHLERVGLHQLRNRGVAERYVAFADLTRDIALRRADRALAGPSGG